MTNRHWDRPIVGPRADIVGALVVAVFAFVAADALGQPSLVSRAVYQERAPVAHEDEILACFDDAMKANPAGATPDDVTSAQAAESFVVELPTPESLALQDCVEEKAKGWMFALPLGVRVPDKGHARSE